MANDTQTSAKPENDSDWRLDSFDHVVVLMLENRSLDNLLGLIYPDGVPACAPAGKTFDGVDTSVSNPVPKTAKCQPPDGTGRVFVQPTSDYHHPYPDPGEEYYHVNTQLYNAPDGGDCPPYNLPKNPPNPPGMQGFVTDYIEKLNEPVSKLDGPPSFEHYSQIMQSFEPNAVPVLSTLAQHFGVFDHWYCAVPSQTWCNRAFWHAGTSWGRVNQKPFGPWFDHNGSTTIFNQISKSSAGLSWNVYHDTPVISLTHIIHSGALWDHPLHFHGMDKFFDDCANGHLPSYSFLEPDFIFQHNDYHPSSAGKGVIDYQTDAGAVLLGEHLVAKVYDAIKGSKGRLEDGKVVGNTWENTLLIITFDEHGGTYDHAHPIEGIEPPDLDGMEHQEGFDFKRSGIRVPTIMVSAHIAKNTVINTPMMHTSFLNTMQQKWGAGGHEADFPPISPRQKSDGTFTEVFTSKDPIPTEQWPPVTPPPLPPHWIPIHWDEPVGDLGQSMIEGLAELLHRKQVEHSPEGVRTLADAKAYFDEAEQKLKQLFS